MILFEVLVIIITIMIMMDDNLKKVEPEVDLQAASGLKADDGNHHRSHLRRLWGEYIIMINSDDHDE